MEKSFMYESANFATDLEVLFDVYAHEEDDACADNITIWQGDVEIKPEQLAEGENDAIERQAQDIANENAHEAYHDAMLAKADAMMDAYKDGTYE